MSHLGRPDGKKNDKYSLQPVVPELEKLLGKPVTFVHDCVGKEVEDTVNHAQGGKVVLLENLRFHAEEEGSSKDAEGKKIKADKTAVENFRKGLTALGDVYISRAPGSYHSVCPLIESQTMLLVPPTEHIAQWLDVSFHRRHPAFL